MAQAEPVVSESTQSKYRRKRNSTADQSSIEENEVRITTRGRVKRYVDYAVRLLSGPQQRDRENEQENENEEKTNNDKESPEKSGPSKQFDTIVLRATGRAIYSAVTTAEVVKRKVANLHQLTELDTLEMTDIWEPLEEGLKEVKTTRRVASICITLSRKPNAEDNSVGYQEPIPAESVGSSRGGRGRGRGRGGYGYGYGRGGYRGNSTDNRMSYGRGNQGGRGRRQDFYNNNNRDRDRESYPIRQPNYGRGFGRRQERDQFGGFRPQGFNSNRPFNNNRRQYGQ